MKLISARTFIFGGILIAVTTCDVSAGVITKSYLNGLAGTVTENFENWKGTGGDGEELGFPGPDWLDSSKDPGKAILKAGLKFSAEDVVQMQRFIWTDVATTWILVRCSRILPNVWSSTSHLAIPSQQQDSTFFK